MLLRSLLFLFDPDCHHTSLVSNSDRSSPRSLILVWGLFQSFKTGFSWDTHNLQLIPITYICQLIIKVHHWLVVVEEGKQNKRISSRITNEEETYSERLNEQLFKSSNINPFMKPSLINKKEVRFEVSFKTLVLISKFHWYARFQSMKPAQRERNKARREGIRCSKYQR